MMYQQYRRYYLHRRVKGFARLVCKNKTVYLPFNFTLGIKQQFYLNELIRCYGYAIQMEIA